MEKKHKLNVNRIILILVVITIVSYAPLDKLLGFSLLGDIIPIMIFIVLALGLNIVVGFTGLLHLGYAAFFAIGAYTTGILTSPLYPFQINFWLVIPISALVTSVFGLILGSPVIRLRGDYLAIVTLGFGEIIPAILRNLRPVTQGAFGINPIGVPKLFGYSFGPSKQIFWYYMVLMLGCLIILINKNLQKSKIGRAWIAIKEDELAASCMGINVVKLKLLAFIVGAGCAGIGGAFFASYIQAIFPQNFEFSISVMILCMVILGGLGNIYGVLLGGAIIMAYDRILSPIITKLAQSLFAFQGTHTIFLEFNNYRYLIFGLALVLMMRLRPEGILPYKGFKVK